MLKKKPKDKVKDTKEDIVDNPFNAAHAQADDTDNNAFIPSGDIENISAQQLAETKSQEELIILATPYVPNWKYKTFKSKSKLELARIIKNRGLEQKSDEPQVRSMRAQTESAEFVDDALNLVEDLKKEREVNEGKKPSPLPSYLRKGFKKYACNTLDNKIDSGAVNLNGYSSILAFILGIGILFVSFIGTDKAAKLIKDFFAKQKDKKTQKKDDKNGNGTDASK